MGTRRLISLDIVDTDVFLDMPVSSQLLYFHLNTRADDDGFVSGPRKIMRMVGAQKNDIDILVSKKFIIPFESGVCVIKHWRINNRIRKDRYTETTYIDEKTSLFIRENGAYTMTEDERAKQVPLGHFTLESISNSKRLPSGRPTVDPKVSKVKLSKVKNNTAAKKAARPKKKKVEAKPMTLDQFVSKMRESPQRHINIIGEYADEKKLTYTTSEQWRVFTNRNLRAARSLTPFTDEQISVAMTGIEKADYITKWGLETLLKFMEN